MLQFHYKELSDKTEGDVLAKFVHIFEQAILMEDGLGGEQFSIEEVENAKKYFPLYSNKFVETILRKKKRFQAGQDLLVTSFCGYHHWFWMCR